MYNAKNGSSRLAIKAKVRIANKFSSSRDYDDGKCAKTSEGRLFGFDAMTSERLAKNKLNTR